MRTSPRPICCGTSRLVYSTTAAYLATRIAGAGQFDPGRAQVNALSYEQIKELQKILVSKGYDVGEVDGKLGRATRARR